MLGLGLQGSYSNKEMRFQYIPVYSRMDRTQFPGHFWCGISHKHRDQLVRNPCVHGLN